MVKKVVKGETPVTAIRIPTDIKEGLEFYAERENRSMSNFVVTILMKWLSEKDKEMSIAGQPRKGAKK